MLIWLLKQTQGGGKKERQKGEGKSTCRLFLVLAVKEVPQSVLLGQTAAGRMHCAAEMVLLAK